MNLDAFFNPRRVAIAGAGDRPTSSGGAVLKNLLSSGFKGEIVPVNPKGGVISGLPARARLQELPAPADLVVVAVRPDVILDVVKDAAASGHKNLLILPGGFAEAGPAGLERDALLQRLIADHGLVVGGPNCAGIINLLDGRDPFAATFLRDMPFTGGDHHRGGRVALVSQSGAVAEEVIASSHALSIPIGASVSVGNAVQLGLTEYLEYVGGREDCSAVLLYAESFGDAERFRQVARKVAARKPVVALLGGRTASGAAAALRHTGSKALADAAAEELCRSCGVVRVTSLRQLMLAAKAFGRFGGGAGRRALVLSNSGGPGVLCADQCAALGLDLVDLPHAMAEELRRALPPEASVANPIDLLADAREDRFGPTLRSALAHGRGAFDVILMIHVMPFMVDGDPVVAELANVARDADLPVMHSMMGTLPKKAAWFAAMEAAGVPTFNDVEEMATAAALLARYRAVRPG